MGRNRSADKFFNAIADEFYRAWRKALLDAFAKIYQMSPLQKPKAQSRSLTRAVAGVRAGIKGKHKWGFKADGTPRKKPGRKAAPVVMSFGRNGMNGGAHA